MSEEINSTDKNIDESWKETVEKEKENGPVDSRQESVGVEINFNSFATSLGLQALIALGEIENPLTGKKEQNRQQAKILIDTLDMIKEKTKNNLTEEETNLLESLLYELKMKYVTKQK